MSDYIIRLYKDSDYEAVSELFDYAVKDFASVAFHQTLRLLHIWIFLLVVFFAPLVVFGSILLAFLSLAFALLVLRMGTREFYHSHVSSGFSNDMKDINKYYLQRDGYNFWVAESAGHVVGMVAAIPSSYTCRDKHLELKRLAVDKSHRGKGIAKALSRTLIDFAREKGYEAVVLATTTAHTEAQHMYEKMGFRYVRHINLSQWRMRFIGIMLVFFQYDLPKGN
ncbi:probable N-acetyltransferase CML1 [Bombina bombina]|uniref:probable N-acetyltransferase CML1 n=1 Tax=Bombina bombina TaxID=8345 RepID=UPI00235A5E0B|nr:probable N-acetyltransferase CML1 [Bombina bombina]